MKGSATMKTGLVGSIIAAVCCFTPVLAIAFGAVGLSAWLAWADFVLFPLLALFLALAVYGWLQRRKPASCVADEPGARNEHA